jgi:hypothetical protein
MRGGWWWLGLVLWLGGIADAALLVPMSDADLVAASDLVLVGRIDRIESVLLGTDTVVTRVTVGVETVLAGDPGATTIVVTEPGGEVGGLRAVVDGAPEWTRGERALLFLRARPDGSLATTALALGKYAVDDAGGTARAVRRAPVRDARPLVALMARVAALATGSHRRRGDGRAGIAIEPPTLSRVTEAFTLARNDSGVPSRWFEPDCGRAIVYDQAGSDTSFGDAMSVAAIANATAAWSGVAGAGLLLASGTLVTPAPTTIGGIVDGRNTVVFDDPFGEVPELVNCTGVLAVGGFIAASISSLPETSRTVGGESFMKIFEGDLVVNPGLADCLSGPLALEEVLTHEIGHTIGFGHSSEDPNEPDPVLEDATMYFRAHDDGRGAAVRADDEAAARTVYPAELVATTPIAVASCEIALGLLTSVCTGQPISSAPFMRMKAATKAASRAAAATTSTKQRRFLKKALKALTKTDVVITKRVGGACGAAMHANVLRDRDLVNAVLATL